MVITTDSSVTGDKVKTGHVYITDDDYSSYSNSSIYLDGDKDNTIFNKAVSNTAEVKSITSRAQPIFDILKDSIYDQSGNLDYNSISSLDDIKSYLITSNYIKTSGKEFKIDTLTLENTPLGNDDRTNIKNSVSLVNTLYNAISGNSSSLEGTSVNFDYLVKLLDSTYLNVTTLEYWANDNYTGTQTFTIGTANLNRYSMLRVNKEKDYSASNKTAINFGTVNMDNITGIAFGIYGNTKAPDSITINTLNVNEGGNDFAYAALLSTNNSEVKIDEINIKNNTLDLAGTPAQTLLGELSDYLIKLGKSDGNDYTTLASKLDSYSQKIDAGMNNGILFKSINDALKVYLHNLSINCDGLDNLLDSYIGDKLNTAWGTVNGITLSALSSNGHVTVNMQSPDLDGSSPQIKIGEVAANTWVDINFDENSLYSKYADGEYAVMLSGSVGTDNTPDENYVIELHYTEGYSDYSDAVGKLNQLATRVGQTSTVVNVDTTDKSDPVKEPTANNADYADTVTMNGKTYTRLLVTVDATGFNEWTYTKGLDKKEAEDGEVATGYEVDWNDDYSQKVETPSTDEDNPSTETPDDEVDDNVSSHRVVNDAKQALLDPSVYTAMLWRVQMNNLVNRLGDLHEAKVPTGAWVRIYGGSLDFDDRHLDSDYIGVQVGADHQVGGGWTVGGALSYTDGDADYRNGGSSDAYAFDFALYGTWVHENGLYVDLVGRVGRVSNDSDINMHVCDSFIHGSDSYDATAWGLSAEVGWKVPVTEMFFIEPQAQLSYAHISSESADFGEYSADYDSIDMLIGRLGVRTGFELPDDHGSIYLRANVLQDFNGDVDSTLSYDSGSVHQKVSSDEDMDDAWFEVGLGATVKFTDNFYLYAECTYADGGDVDSVYGNLGARLMF